MKGNILLTEACLAAVALSGTTASAQLISDAFEVDSSASYTVLDESNATSGDGTPDSTIDFAFDYIAAGIPLAPNSLAGDTGGLRMAVNETSNDAGPADHITAFHNTVLSGSYSLQVDIYMGVESAGGTTEFSSAGIGSDALDFNSIFTPIAGDGHFLSMTGDGGSGSDYRHFVEGTPVADGDASYRNDLNTTNAPGDTYQEIFPGGDFPGSPGNRWTTLTINATSSKVSYLLDGTTIIVTDSADIDGQVSLGYGDMFSSVGPHFVVFDNLIVSEIPEPTSLALLGMGALGLLVRRRQS
ncbi:PEP-CTERM sorting domain-containing protein [Adhaeretor mobilis]|uniref:PEP-CTERM motif protein n=1 Tax=Adhaeretor mobilis TaxID=1930276 RepID=A0A517MQT0_9BACT|nr:PEP-CTERM sorting domain-containing protein [Adhaeretor mobilis]QDS97239.1 PEP-CTERM motif protein [Adhaeretor mobilis]